MKKLGLTALIVFILGWVVVGILNIPGCNYSAMPQREVTEEYRFYNFKVKSNEILIVFVLAKHDQDLSWIKSNEDYDVISVDKVYRSKGDGSRFRRPTQLEAIKVYLQPKRSFLLNWTYLADTGERNVLYTRIEVQ